MSDRHEQAGAEAERRIPRRPERGLTYPVGALDTHERNGFLAGVEWADANHPAVEALARVRELHYRVTTCHLGDDAYCHHDGLAWPCMTIMATEVEA